MDDKRWVMPSTMGLMPDFARIRLSENFFEDEFRCPCPRCKDVRVSMDEVFIALLQLARDSYNHPMTITAGWRCREHQLELNPEVPNSSHTRGMAADVRCISSRENYEMAGAFRHGGFTRLGRYFQIVENRAQWTHIHIDSDPSLPEGVEWVGKAR